MVIDDIKKRKYNDISNDDESQNVIGFLKDIKNNEDDLQNKRTKNKSDEKWTKGMLDEDIIKYGPKMNEITKVINGRIIAVSDILGSHMSINNKAKLMEELHVLKSLPKNSQDYLDMKYKLYDKFKSNTMLTEDQVKVIDNFNVDNKTSLIKKIVESCFNDKTKRTLLSMHDRLTKIHPSNEEYDKLYNRIGTILKLPTESHGFGSPDQANITILQNVKTSLDKHLYGQKTVKNRILELVGSLLTNPDIDNKCIVFVGNAGVGKTSLARALSEALQLPMYQISLGGITDPTFIKGHGSTYIGAKPGEIVSALTHMGYNDGILFLDEFDKIESGSNISNSMLHILDPTQDSEFVDLFIPEVPINLSKVVKIVSINDPYKVNKILRTRLPLVKFNDYDIKDKVKIAKRHIIPLLKDRLGLHNITIPKHVIRYIILRSNKRHEPGVRQVQHNMKVIFERINVIKMMTKVEAKELGIKYWIKINDPHVLTESHASKLFNEYKN
jgi:ATP-dependent Lon protease